jgi:hypothetical protein
VASDWQGIVLDVDVIFENVWMDYVHVTVVPGKGITMSLDIPNNYCYRLEVNLFFIFNTLVGNIYTILTN